RTSAIALSAPTAVDQSTRIDGSSGNWSAKDTAIDSRNGMAPPPERVRKAQPPCQQTASDPLEFRARHRPRERGCNRTDESGITAALSPYDMCARIWRFR